MHKPHRTGQGWRAATRHHHQKKQHHQTAWPQAQSSPRCPEASQSRGRVSVGRLEPMPAARGLVPSVPAGVCAASSSLRSSLSSSAAQEPSLSGLACQSGTSPGCGPPGFMALISRQPDLDTAGSGSPVPMESATQEAAKPFLCAGRKGALLACPGGQRESRGSGLWESKRTNEAKQNKKPPEESRGSQKGGEGGRPAIPRIICRCSKSVSPTTTALHPLTVTAEHKRGFH